MSKMKSCIGFIALFYISLLFPDNLNFYLEDNKTSSFILFHEGKIKVEKEFLVKEPSDFYKIASEGNVDGRSLEDVASIQKSIVSLLIGIAQQKGTGGADFRAAELALKIANAKHTGRDPLLLIGPNATTTSP